jgi:chromosome segregation ATPase
MADRDTQEIQIELARLTKDVEQVSNIQNRLDTAIDKLTDVGADIKSMLAVHEEKIEHQEKIDEVIFSKLKVRAEETSSIEKDLKDHIEESEKRVKEEIKLLKDEFRGRISLLEKYKWIIIGAFIAVEFITVLMISKKGMFPLFSLFK